MSQLEPHPATDDLNEKAIEAEWCDLYIGYFAIYPDTYCGAIDSNSPIGFGSTEAKAIHDLKENTNHEERV